MIKLFKQRSTTAAVIIALSLTGCSRFDTRMQANGTFDYQKTQLTPPYQTADFSNDEARTQFAVPALTDMQSKLGFLTHDVDIRPPTQLIAVIDGVSLDASEKQQTKIWFNAFKQNDDIATKVWQLLESYLAENKVPVIAKDNLSQQLETGVFSQKTNFGGFLNSSEVEQQSSYRFTLEKQSDGHSVALNVQALTYRESSEGKPLKFNMSNKNKKNIELRFVNDLLVFAYKEQESNELKDLDSQPLPIKLGFDDNHQNVWVIETQFLETWRKLPALLSLLNFDVVEADKNLGYFLLKYNPPNSDYWAENNLNPFELESAEYFIQLGELTGGSTSISWLDEDKAPISDQKVTEIYLSITDRVRNVLLLQDKQTKPL
ncbi:outer membrane protein assembly factor BamC [Psychromonas antarctica]|jgi:outer membrane protein assembly factor BamC|uniref:outer membrane protein assembly factor BamC n=1 Tax=Psychromonas antarctica TaxID=67573 RepID=UPI001EE8DC07|nr:outer membrane protein assembly factor BamC [Psychromonas antarctica]MCG6201209.1 outer membrane protein assembly factor BamC [Psychromonas antarctica]